MSELRVGLLGAGRIGRLHADLLVHRVVGTGLAAIYDPLEAEARSLAGSLDVDVDVAGSASELLARDLDAVAICTTTETHASLIEQAAAAGLHVFCEKPISLRLDEVDRAIAAVTAAGVKLQVGFNRRFDPSHRAVRDRIAAGDIGRPYLARITSRDPAPPSRDYLASSGGLFLDMTVHDFDMASFLLGSDVVEVYAAGAAVTDPVIAELGDIDIAAITLRYADGTLAMIDNCRHAAYGYDQRVEVLGAKGMARSENVRDDQSVLEDGTGAHRPTGQFFFLERYLESYVAQWRSFVAAVVDGTPVEVDGTAARLPIALAHAAAESHRTGRPVPVDTSVGVPAS